MLLQGFQIHMCYTKVDWNKLSLVSLEGLNIFIQPFYEFFCLGKLLEAWIILYLLVKNCLWLTTYGGNYFTHLKIFRYIFFSSFQQNLKVFLNSICLFVCLSFCARSIYANFTVMHACVCMCVCVYVCVCEWTR